MNSRNTWIWLFVAAALFVYVFFIHEPKSQLPAGPQPILKGLRPAAVTSIQIRHRDKLSRIRVDRTNNIWQLNEPVVYPARSTNINEFLNALEHLTAAAYITGLEHQQNPKAEEEAGLSPARTTIVLQPGDRQIWIGSLTPPGNQLFLEVIDTEGIFVVDADFLNIIPSTGNDWRDTTLVDFKAISFDRISVTNGPKVFELKRDVPQRPWRRIYPQRDRANNALITVALEKLQAIQIHEFVSDDPKVDLVPYGLQPPELELGLGQATNPVVLLQFGKSPTNDPGRIYARRRDQNSIVTVDSEALAAWRGSINDFRDPHLLSQTDGVDVIQVVGADAFSLQRQTNNSWRVLPLELPADQEMVSSLISALGALTVVEFVKDVVTEPDLQPLYGLALPGRQYILRGALTNASAGFTNPIIAQLDFGAHTNDRIYARRSDESPVYAVKLDDFQHLPYASWQFRERRVFNVSTNDITGVTIHQGAKVRRIVRKGPYSWSLAPGSQGIINDVAVEETVRGLCKLTAVAWVARGEQNSERFGCKEPKLQITLESKNGENFSVHFGNPPYACVTLGREMWFFEFPWLLAHDVEGCLTIPPGTP